MRGKVTIKLISEEMELLNEFCKAVNRPHGDVARFILMQGLNSYLERAAQLKESTDAGVSTGNSTQVSDGSVNNPTVLADTTEV